MLKIQTQYVSEIQNAASLSDLHVPLQNAIELEHATLPPYLTAMFSLVPEKNREIRELLHSIVVEEMGHMTIACNILNAFNGSPDINNAAFIPKYPGKLPMHIGGDLKVNLAAYSKAVVFNTFMVIEEPDKPLDFPKAVHAADPEFKTIGDFYCCLKDKITDLNYQGPLPGDSGKQVTSTAFPTSDVFPIITSADAIRAINVIVEQGEGTTKLPIDEDGNYAHYYRFNELYVGKRLRKDTGVKEGYSFSGADIPFDSSAKGVYPILANTKAEDIPKGTEQRRQAEQFNYSYGKLLNGLHRTFNGEPEFLKNTLGLMFDLTLIGEKLCSMKYPPDPTFNCGTPFQYVKINTE